MKLNLTAFIALTALASGCAEKEQTEATYWTQKSGVIVVHHIKGKVDSTEKLSEKQLTADEISARGLTKGQKYFEVVGSDTPARPPKTDAQKNAKKEDAT